MKFSTIFAATTLVASGVSAQLSATNPLQLIQYLEFLLTPSCRNTIDTVFASNSSIGQCLNLQAARGVLGDNSSSLVPAIDTYLRSVCSSPACQPSVITNATNQILSNCASDLSNFGISNDTVRIVTGIYPTARKVACLSSSNSTLFPTSYRNSTGNSTLCPTALLDDLQTYLGANLSNNYIVSTVLGANATAYRQILAIGQNATVLKSLGCNDCVQASVDIVLEDYPGLNNFTFNLNLGQINNATALNVTSPTSRFTIPSLYQNVCGVPVGYNVSLPRSINETAYNTTVGVSNRTTATASIIPSSTATSRKRFVRWD